LKIYNNLKLSLKKYQVQDQCQIIYKHRKYFVFKSMNLDLKSILMIRLDI